MIRIDDSVYIDAPPTRIWAWLSELPRHYREWHPDHIDCRYSSGHGLTVGAVLCIEERLHGKVHRFKLRATVVDSGRLLRYTNHGFRGSFELVPENRGTRFISCLEFGTDLPVIRRIVDAILRHGMGNRLEELRTHMQEESHNLKQLMEPSR